MTDDATLAETLLLHAEAVLADAGIQGFTLEEVARRSGMGDDAVAAVFGDSHGILDALFIQGHENFHANDIEASADPVGDLLRGFDMYRDWSLAHPVYYRLMFAPLDQGYEPSPNAGNAGWRNFEALTIRAGRAVASGTIEGAPLDIALDLWAVAHGSVMLELAGPGIFHDAPEERYRARMRRTLDSFRPAR